MDKDINKPRHLLVEELLDGGLSDVVGVLKLLLGPLKDGFCWLNQNTTISSLKIG